MAFNRQFVAGAYKVQWDLGGDPAHLGYTEAGFELNIEVADPVPVQEDRHGLSVIDAIWQLIQSCTLRIESLYWAADTWAAVFPHITSIDDATNAVTAGSLLKQGGYAKSLTLTPITGSALVVDNYVWTFLYAYPVEPVNLTFSSRELRRVPAAFQIFPTLENNDTDEAQWWTRAAL
jgi:hypothetical protein